MIDLPDVAALVLLASLLAYALTGGADFGGGVWDLLASGPRAARQRQTIARAIAPVWEANHVWLILVVVVLFTAFPPAFAAASIALHVPLTVMLLGIVLRGAAFVFRQYGAPGGAQARWGTVFAVASVVTPFCLGVVLGAITAEGVRLAEDGSVTGGFVAPWLGAFPFAVGALALAAFAFLAAVYLIIEAPDALVRADFRARALWSGAAMALAAAGAAASAGEGAPRFRAALLGSWWSAPLLGAAALLAAAAAWALLGGRFLAARALAVALVAVVVVGWGAAQHPMLIAPDLTIAGAAAPRDTLAVLVPVLGAGAVVLAPSLWWMLRVFKR